jgi:hypothetical protein
VKRYRVILPVEIDGKVYEYGHMVELELEQALAYAHALILLDVKGEEE